LLILQRFQAKRTNINSCSFNILSSFNFSPSLLAWSKAEQLLTFNFDMDQIFTDDEIIADSPKEKKILQIIRWVIKILVTILTSMTTVIGMNSCM